MVGPVLVSHIAHIRKLKGFENAMAVIIPESNLPVIPEELLRAIKNSQISNCMFMNENEDSSKTGIITALSDLPGSKTHRGNKPTMAKMMETILLKKNIIFHDHFTVAFPEYSNCGIVKDEMYNEFLNFKREVIQSKLDPHKGSELKYHGKDNGNNDDLVMAALIGPYSFRKFLSDDKYKVYRKNFSV